MRRLRRGGGKSVADWVEGDTSGKYESFLLACLKAEREEWRPVDEGLAAEQAARLHAAGLAEGSDVDAEVWCDVLSKASAPQVEAIKQIYQDDAECGAGKPLLEAVKDAMGGDWERVLLARLQDKPTYYASTLYKAMKVWGTDDKTVARILGRNSKAAITRIGAKYQELHGVSLHEAISGDTSGNFKKALLTMIFAESPGEDADPGEVEE